MSHLPWTPRQREIVHSWGTPWENEEITAMHFAPLPDGRRVACLERFIFTMAISILSDPLVRETRWCYGSLLEARVAYEVWVAGGFEGMPENYIKQKPEAHSFGNY